MSGTRLIRYLAAAVGSVIALACADYATAPSASLQPPSTTVFFRGLDAGSLVHGVRWLGNGPSGDLSTSGVIGPNGGTLSIPDADFTIVFPQGAVGKPTLITITANSDGYIGYEMLPHGLTFGVPVIATQGLGRAQKTAGVFCAYLPPGVGIGADGSANAREIEQSTTNYGVQIAGRARAIVQVWTLNHFSRYILASGFTDDDNSPPPAN
jgi:hypothetical protein